MGRYALEVVAPYENGVPSEDADRLAFALESLAMIHGGKVVEPSDGAASPHFRRQFVNIYDCESSLASEVEWLKKQFPTTRFTLKQFMQSEPQARPSP